MVAPSASTMVRVWPTLPQTPSWSRTSLIGGIAAYRWRKRSGSGGRQHDVEGVLDRDGDGARLGQDDA